MEPFYYSKMNKMQQATYHAICQGVLRMEKEIQVPVSYTHLTLPTTPYV